MLSSTGPSTYKIPSFTDVPANIKVYLLHNSNNIKGVYGSKGIGEPALLLGNSVFFGIRQAILETSSYSKGKWDHSARSICEITTVFSLNRAEFYTVESLRLIGLLLFPTIWTDYAELFCTILVVPFLPILPD